jgi:7,8-dihydroneopterin aldolase/epimerase/oxygenase
VDFSHALHGAPISMLRHSSAAVRALRRGCSTSAAPPSDLILLRGLLFHAHHGVLAAEQELGQKFRLDLSLEVDLRAAGRSDQLEGTVDYAAVYETVRHEVTVAPPRLLLEKLAHCVAARVLGGFPGVRAARVRVMKPHVAVQGVLDGLGASSPLRCAANVRCSCSERAAQAWRCIGGEQTSVRRSCLEPEKSRRTITLSTTHIASLFRVPGPLFCPERRCLARLAYLRCRVSACTAARGARGASDGRFEDERQKVNRLPQQATRSGALTFSIKSSGEAVPCTTTFFASNCTSKLVTPSVFDRMRVTAPTQLRKGKR